MEKRFIIFNMDSEQYYTGMYYNEINSWDSDANMAERFKSIDEIDDILNDDTKREGSEFFIQYPQLEIKTIFIRK